MDTHQISVLLVEGDDLSAQRLTEDLQRRECRVHRVSCVLAAANKLESGLDVDLVLIDAALGNEAAQSPAATILLTQGPVVALADPGTRDEPGPCPTFACHGCVAKNSGAAILGVSLRTALRLFREIRETHARKAELARVAHQAQLALWEYDPETSQLCGSHTLHEILGLPDDAQPSLAALSGLYAPGPSDTLIRAIELAHHEGKPFSLLSEITTPTEHRKWVRIQGEATPTRCGRHRVYGTLQDFSELHLIDHVQQTSELTLSQVEQITHVGHWAVSVADGSFFHSDETKRIFGYEPSEYALSVEQAIDAYHPDDREEVIRIFNRAIETGEGYEFDLRLIQPSGDIRYVHSKGYTKKDNEGRVTHVYGVFQDITEQTLAELALRESEGWLKALVNAVHTGIVVHGKDGAILLSNQMANRLLAPLAASLAGRKLDDPAWRFCFEDGRKVETDDLPASQILRTRKPIKNVVLGQFTDDTMTWLLVNGVPVIDETGELSKVIMSFVDITERKEMEERLHQAEKMTAIGQLAGGVAHDFNNQLMVMLNFAELLKESFAEGSTEISFVQGIQLSVSRSADLTKQLLAFARKGKYVVKTIDVNKLILEVVSMARRSFDKKIRIEHHPSAKAATVAADASQLQNALLNMALNSRDAMPSGGELRFSTSLVTLEAPFIRSAGLDSDSGDYVRIEIRDNGTGMTIDTQHHIFEPFFTTKAPGKGTGMGMASVYGTVKNHHGAIEVESEPGQGTTITVLLPLSLADHEATGAPAIEAKTDRPRVLLIDDEEALLSTMKLILRREGYDATTFLDGHLALAYFERSWQSIQVVLLDMIMPGMNGVEIFHALKAIDPNVKVILISGYSIPDEARKLGDGGAVGFLQKPVAAKELLQTISDALSMDSGIGAPR